MIVEVPGHGQVEFPDDMSDEAVAAAIKKNLLVGKTSKTMPANAGLANFGASVAGLPVDALTNAYNLFKAGIGTAQNKIFGTPLPEMTKAPIGSSEDIKARLRSTGEPGLSPDNPQPNSKTSSAQYDFTARGGFLPGGVLPAAGSMVAEHFGGPQWAGVGALIPQAASTAYSNVRGPQLAKQEQRNAMKDATFEEARKEGYVVPPSAVGGGWISRRLESIGGKAAIGQDAALRNQEVTNAIGRREASLPENRAISEGTLENVRGTLAAPYRDVEQLSSTSPLARAPFKSAAETLKELQQVRHDANDQWRFYERSADPSAKAKAQQLSDKAMQLEEHIEALAKSTGQPELINEVRQARKDMAKTFDVGRALNVATGDVSAPILGRMVDSGKPLSGGLRTTGNFQQAFPAYAREGAAIPTPGVSKSEALAGAVLGMQGQAGGLGWWPMGLPLVSGPARSLLLSRPYQGVLSSNYKPMLTPEDQMQALVRLGILSERAQ